MAERPQHASLSLHVQQKRRSLGAVKKSLLTSYDSIVLMTVSFLACCDQRHSSWDGGVGKCWELWEVPGSLRMGLALRSFCRTWKHSLELSLVSVALFYTCSFQCSWFVLTRTWQTLALEPLKLWAKQMASWWIVCAGSAKLATPVCDRMNYKLSFPLFLCTLPHLWNSPTQAGKTQTSPAVKVAVTRRNEVKYQLCSFYISENDLCVTEIFVKG